MPKRDFFTFDVMTCKDARLALSTTPGEHHKNTFEIVIGSSDDPTAKLVYIDSEGNSHLQDEAGLHNLVHCDESRQFWVSWDNLRVEVGMGELGNNKFLSNQGTFSDHLTAVSISTGNDSMGQWSFLQADGKVHNTINTCIV